MKAKKIAICAKCSDLFAADLFDEDDNHILAYGGYVPDFMPGDHYGDYIELEIDLETGRILNWTTPSEEDLDKMAEQNYE